MFPRDRERIRRPKRQGSVGVAGKKTRGEKERDKAEPEVSILKEKKKKRIPRQFVGVLERHPCINRQNG